MVNAAAARDIKNAPNMKAEFEQKQREALALIEKKYAVKAPKTPGARDDSAATDRAAAAAQQQLIQMLASVQGQLRSRRLRHGRSTTRRSTRPTRPRTWP
ncbi:hypothetical protein [Rhodanobacter lindaniclasticus]